MKTINGGVTSPLGFSAAGAHVGLKKVKKDLCLIASDAVCAAAGVFTTNIVKAAPVVWDEKIIKQGGGVRGIVVNSGNANACTGEQGMKDCGEMAQTYAQLLGCDAGQVMVCSTGVICVKLPMDTVNKGITETYPALARGEAADLDAIDGIMTTDTFRKMMALELNLSGKTVRIGGMAKGSGMIHPNMATMLAFITTDAVISSELLQKALKSCADTSFNRISVDGDTSTNDTLLALASGLAGNDELTEGSEECTLFVDALRHMCTVFAKEVTRDGEGATKLMEVTVTGAKTHDDAVKAARSVTSSNLFKAALFGEDANWGRAMCAMGYSGAAFDPSKVTVFFRSAAGRIQLMNEGDALSFDEELAAAILKESDIFIDITMKDGEASATAWGCDLTYDYVKINGDYRS
jgi:glutamate N-acetyltransferase/amino-acid N-acetyltransferase